MTSPTPTAPSPLADRFSLTARVGSGTYGQVWLATRPDDPDQRWSVKQSRIVKEEQSITPSIFRELVVLSGIQHPHIVRISMKDVICDFDAHLLSFAYEYGAIDVRKLVSYYSSKKAPIKPVVVKSVLFQLLLALDHLHKRSIAHCDVTPSNLLLMAPNATNYAGVVKLIDFGLSRIIDASNTQRNCGVVTVWYRAPELLLGDGQYDQKVDIWAAGCIFAELLTGQVLFAVKQKVPESDPTAFNPSQMSQIFEIMGPMREGDCARDYRFKSRAMEMQAYGQGSSLRQNVRCDELAFDLLSKMLVYNPDRRLTAAQALRHQYFNEPPICVINVAGQIPKDEWDMLVTMGGKTSEN
jgi:cyclin-dependent kinase 8/11